MSSSGHVPLASCLADVCVFLLRSKIKAEKRVFFIFVVTMHEGFGPSFQPFPFFSDVCARITFISQAFILCTLGVQCHLGIKSIVFIYAHIRS